MRKLSKIQSKTKNLGKNYAFSTKKWGILSIIVMTEATLLFHCGSLPFLAFLPVGFLGQWR